MDIRFGFNQGEQIIPEPKARPTGELPKCKVRIAGPDKTKDPTSASKTASKTVSKLITKPTATKPSAEPATEVPDAPIDCTPIMVTNNVNREELMSRIRRTSKVVKPKVEVKPIQEEWEYEEALLGEHSVQKEKSLPVESLPVESVPKEKSLPKEKSVSKKKSVITGEKLQDDPLSHELKPHGLAIRDKYYLNNRVKIISMFKSLFKGFKTEKTDRTCETLNTGEHSLLDHQVLVKTYINNRTPYRGLLLYHGLGSGKTFSSIAISEGFISSREIIVMTPASLQPNYRDELKKYGNDIIIKKNRWKRNKVTKKWTIDESGKLYEELSEAKKVSLNQFLNDLFEEKYRFYNYNGKITELIEPVKHIKDKKDISLIENNPFSNRVVIIDEAHNFVSRIVNKLKLSAKQQQKSNFIKLYELLLNAENVRIILLTGTPVINYANEIGVMMNILRGYINVYEFKITSAKPLDISRLKKILKPNAESSHEHESEADTNTYNYTDYIKYSPSDSLLTIARNPFEFITDDTNSDQVIYSNTFNREMYGSFITNIIQKLQSHGITVKGTIKTKQGADMKKQYKCLPDDLDEFQKMFISETKEPNRRNYELKNSDKLQRRIVGLVSYFPDIEELLPKLNEIRYEYIEMSDSQFSNYQKIRFKEHERERVAKSKEQNELYENISSSYRIFSRMVCNFSFPIEVKRPIPGIRQSFNEVINSPDSKLDDINLNSEDIDNLTVEERAQGKKLMYGLTDGKSVVPRPDDDESQPSKSAVKDSNINEDVELYEEVADDIKDQLTKGINQKTYSDEILECLDTLENYIDPNPVKSPGGLNMITHGLDKLNLGKYSPKYLKLLNNISDERNANSLHLVYSQFRRVEGIGIFKLVLDRNGFNEFVIRKENRDSDYEVDTKTWNLNEEYASPKYILYTGQEDKKKKEILKDIYNSNWDNVPVSLHDKIIKIYNNVNKNKKDISPDFVPAKSIQECTNKFGDIIKVIMITSSGAEGISLKNVRFVHIIEPFWHPVRNQQIIGRARRICSHKELSKEKQDVTVYMYIMTIQARNKIFNFDLADDGQYNLTTDEYLHRLSENKKSIVKKLLYNLKAASIDCSVYEKDGIKCLSTRPVMGNELLYDMDYAMESHDDFHLNIRSKINP